MVSCFFLGRSTPAKEKRRQSLEKWIQTKSSFVFNVRMRSLDRARGLPLGFAQRQDLDKTFSLGLFDHLYLSYSCHYLKFQQDQWSKSIPVVLYDIRSMSDLLLQLVMPGLGPIFIHYEIRQVCTLYVQLRNSTTNR